MLHSIFFNKKTLLEFTIPKHALSADIMLKPIIGRVWAYNNSFTPNNTAMECFTSLYCKHWLSYQI